MLSIKLIRRDSSLSYPQSKKTHETITIGSLDMNRSLSLSGIAITLALALSACTAGPPPVSTPAPSSALPSVSFDSGDSLPTGTEVSWRYGFANDTGWVDVGDAPKPGWRTFVRKDKLCSAAFHGSELTGTVGMNDEEATDVVIAAELGEDFGELDGLVSDGHFSRYAPGSPPVAHHQFSLSIDEYGRFIAARAFVSVHHSVTVVVTCDGADVNRAAQEVLTKNTIVIESP